MTGGRIYNILMNIFNKLCCLAEIIVNNNNCPKTIEPVSYSGKGNDYNTDSYICTLGVEFIFRLTSSAEDNIKEMILNGAANDTTNIHCEEGFVADNWYYCWYTGSGKYLAVKKQCSSN